MIKYFNVWDVVQSTSYFLYMFIGGRGIGKTYSTLKGVLNDGAYFMYVRRTQTELDNCIKPENNPFITLNTDLKKEVEISKSGDGFVINEKDKIIGVAGALSTFGKFRGSDFSKVEYIIFDEFIRTVKFGQRYNEAEMFFNMLETVNRNRELNGEKSIKVILLSNANTIDNDIIREFRLGEIIHRMKKENIEVYTDRDRGLYLSLINNNSVSKAKAETALYRLTRGTKFYDMSINNEFTADDFDNVYKVDYKTLIPVCSFENMYVYKSKTNDFLFVSYRKSNVPAYSYDTLKRFKRDYGLMFQFYVENNLIDYDIKLDFLHIWQ